MLSVFQENILPTGEEWSGMGLVKGDYFVFAVGFKLSFTRFFVNELNTFGWAWYWKVELQTDDTYYSL